MLRYAAKFDLEKFQQCIDVELKCCFPDERLGTQKGPERFNLEGTG